MTKFERIIEAATPFKAKYGNFIGGNFVAPVKGQYFDNISPVNGKVLCQIARSTAEDIENALDSAHAAKEAWGKTSTTERANILNKIADRMEANLALLAEAETWDNGKPIRETTAADLPLAIDHFRYFAGCIRAQEGSIAEIDANTIAYHFHEPLGVVCHIQNQLRASRNDLKAAGQLHHGQTISDGLSGHGQTLTKRCQGGQHT